MALNSSHKNTNKDPSYTKCHVCHMYVTLRSNSICSVWSQSYVTVFFDEIYTSDGQP